MNKNKYASLISLIDTIYPPLLCTLCDTVSTSRIASNQHFKEKHKIKSRYLCIHPHCTQSFLSRGALRFHISRSHLVHYSKKPLPDPPCVHYNNNNNNNNCNKSTPVIKTLINNKNNHYNNNIHTLTSTTTLTKPIITTPQPQAPQPQAPQPQSKLKPQPPLSLSPSPLPNTQDMLETTTPIITTKKLSPKKEKVYTSISIDELTPSPPPSPFSLYHSRKNSSKKPTLSSTAEDFLNSMYPPLQCPSCLQVFNRKTNVIKHLTEAHLGQEPYRCIYPKCAHPRLYATREGLVYHIVRVHDVKK
ncbi:hypothetical protein HPULCUR_005425 [Helicostylum pulchrum]|uniref:C2H2-type domain-containing protein n=1 Tax=Helicostylum pulchrum TaxID=562976 RepID=A0ABP9XZ15_9FUNG